jgi:hypothetical protein
MTRPTFERSHRRVGGERLQGQSIVAMSLHGDEQTRPAIAANGENSALSRPSVGCRALGFRGMAGLGEGGPTFGTPGISGVDPLLPLPSTTIYAAAGFSVVDPRPVSAA